MMDIDALIRELETKTSKLEMAQLRLNDAKITIQILAQVLMAIANGPDHMTAQWARHALFDANMLDLRHPEIVR